MKLFLEIGNLGEIRRAIDPGVVDAPPKGRSLSFTGSESVGRHL